MKLAIACMGSIDTMGGESRVAYEFAKSAVKHFDSVAIIGTGAETSVKSEFGYLNLSVKGEIGDNFGVTRLLVSDIEAIFNFLDEFKPDIIHSHSLAGIPILVQIWAKMNKVPFFYTTHYIPSKMGQWLAENTSSLTGMLLKTPITKTYFRTYFDNCDGVVALNDSAFNDMKEYGYKGAMYKIPNGRELEQYLDIKPTKLGKNIRLIFVGSISERKNQKFLVEVMKYLPKTYSLALVGRAMNPKYEQEMRDIAKEYDLNVDFVGKVDPKEIPSILGKHHLFLSASTAEVQALSVIEALGSSTPVVGLANETIDELIDGSNGVRLAKNATHKRFAGEILKIIDGGEKEYINLCKNSAKRVEDFNWDSVILRTKEVYKKHINGERVVEIDKKAVFGLLEYLPEFKSKEAIENKIREWEKLGENGVKRIRKVGNVNGKTMAFAGLTLAAFALLYGSYKISKGRKGRAK